mgnify:CR=1 FL=1
MLKKFVAFSIVLAFAAGPLSPARADAGVQEPPLSRSSASAWLPDSPCDADDHVCQAFVNGRAYPVQGVPLAIWREARCLSVVAFHEARGEGPLGMKAVIWVALNRSHAQNLRPCRVIAAPGQFDPRSRQQLRQAAQTGAMPRPMRLPAHAVADAEALAWARGLAWRTLMGELTLDPTLGATYFHARYVRPDWSRRFLFTTQIGAHRFYRSLDPGPRNQTRLAAVTAAALPASTATPQARSAAPTRPPWHSRASSR